MLSEIEKAKKKLELLLKRYLETELPFHDYSEQDTATKLIKPLLEILGWDTRNIFEVKEQVRVKIEDKDSFADCVLYYDRKPYVVLEIKDLGFGNLPRTPDSLVVKLLIDQANGLNAKYAVLTRYWQTVIFDPKTGKELAYFDYPNEYISNFESLRRYLSKTRAT